MGYFIDLIKPPKTFKFNEYKNIDRLNIPQEIYDKILSTVNASVSKSRYSQGVVIIEKIKGKLKNDMYLAQDVIHFTYTYNNFFSNDDLEQVIDSIKLDNGHRIGFIYHVLGNSLDPIEDKLHDLKEDTERLITPKPQSYEDYNSNPSKPVLNSAGDCGHLWIYEHGDSLEFKALLPSDKVPILHTKKRFTNESRDLENHPLGIRYIHYLKIDSPVNNLK